MSRILIVGAGIAGLCLARQLKKLGLAYTLIEKKPGLEVVGAGIALPANAVRALRYMGLSEAVDKMHQVQKIIYSCANGRIIRQASLLQAPLNMDKFVALERSELLQILKQGISEDIHFNTTITAMKPMTAGVDLEFSTPALNGHYQAVIGADGIYSSVRELGFGQLDLADLSITTWRWLADYPTKDLQPTYMLGGKSLFLAYPIGPNRVYCYAHYSDKEGSYLNANAAQSNLTHLFADYRGVAKSLLKMLPENAQIHTGCLQSMPSPLFNQGDIALIGDASSACSPTLQQGAACAIEDAIVLSELLAAFPVRQALEQYGKLRYQRVHWVMQQSDKSMQASVKMHSKFAKLIRNLFILYKGPFNVLCWKQLFANCPLEELETLLG